MMMSLQIVLGISLLCIVHSYVIYPLWLMVRTGRTDETDYKPIQDWPHVDVIMSAYNEETVLREKIENLLGLDYPDGKLHIYIGSDGSSDATEQILESYARSTETDHSHADRSEDSSSQNRKPSHQLYCFPYRERRGKSSVINDLLQESAQRTGASILLMTDASVMCHAQALKLGVGRYRSEDLSYLDYHIQTVAASAKGISQDESLYQSLETRLKDLETRRWRRPMGVYGGFYLLGRDDFTPVPSDFAVDDFYLTMNVMLAGGRGAIMTERLCWEPHSGRLMDEYRRKRRIAAGNFQNFWHFIKRILRAKNGLTYSFISHKALRWTGPIWMLLALLCSLALALYANGLWVVIALLIWIPLVVLPLADLVISNLAGQKTLLSKLRYFVWMNVAMFAGMIRHLYGIKANIWDPPSRS